MSVLMHIPLQRQSPYYWKCLLLVFSTQESVDSTSYGLYIILPFIVVCAVLCTLYVPSLCFTRFRHPNLISHCIHLVLDYCVLWGVTVACVILGIGDTTRIAFGMNIHIIFCLRQSFNGSGNEHKRVLLAISYLAVVRILRIVELLLVITYWCLSVRVIGCESMLWVIYLPEVVGLCLHYLHVIYTAISEHSIMKDEYA